MKTSSHTVALAIAATLCMSGVAVATASAAEAEFDASAAGTLSAKALKTSDFHTKAVLVECSALSATGSIAAGKKTTQDADVNYETCKSFGLTVKISVADYEFHANGEVTILKPIILTEVSESYCKVDVPDQTVSTVAYKNLSTGMELVPAVSKIKSIGSGTSTLCDYGTEEAGTYEGTSEVKNSGGTIEHLAG